MFGIFAFALGVELDGGVILQRCVGRIFRDVGWIPRIEAESGVVCAGGQFLMTDDSASWRADGEYRVPPDDWSWRQKWWVELLWAYLNVSVFRERPCIRTLGSAFRLVDEPGIPA